MKNMTHDDLYKRRCKNIPGPTDSGATRWERVHGTLWLGVSSSYHFNCSRKFFRYLLCFGLFFIVSFFLFGMSSFYYYNKYITLLHRTNFLAHENEKNLALIHSVNNKKESEKLFLSHDNVSLKSKAINLNSNLTKPINNKQDENSIASVEEAVFENSASTESLSRQPFLVQNASWKQIGENILQVQVDLLPQLKMVKQSQISGRICTVLKTTQPLAWSSWPAGIQLTSEHIPKNCHLIGELVKFKRLRPMTWTFSTQLMPLQADKVVDVFFLDIHSLTGVPSRVATLQSPLLLDKPGS